MSSSAELFAAAPYLDVANPAFSIRSPEVMAAREKSWFARTPYGIAVLRYDEVNQLLRLLRICSSICRTLRHASDLLAARARGGGPFPFASPG